MPVYRFFETLKGNNTGSELDPADNLKQKMKDITYFKLFAILETCRILGNCWTKEKIIAWVYEYLTTQNLGNIVEPA